MLLRLLALARAPVEPAEAEVAVGDEGRMPSSSARSRASRYRPCALSKSGAVPLAAMSARTHRIGDPNTVVVGRLAGGRARGLGLQGRVGSRNIGLPLP